MGGEDPLDAGPHKEIEIRASRSPEPGLGFPPCAVELPERGDCFVACVLSPPPIAAKRA